MSPIHHLLEIHNPAWGRVGGVPIALHFGDVEAERRAVQTLALCDLGPLAKFGVKGPLAERWLTESGIDVPAGVYESRRLSDGGIIARTGTGEFFLESGAATAVVPALAAELRHARPEQVYHVEHQEAAFLIIGSRAVDVLAQTCGVDFRETPRERVVYTRVAGVSCGVFPQEIAGVPAYRLWLDPSFAVDLWESLVEISSELGGRIVGAAAVGLIAES